MTTTRNITASTSLSSALSTLGVAQPGTTILMAAGQSGPIWGGTGASFVNVCSTVLPADTIQGGSTLRFRMLLVKYPPVSAGHAYFVEFLQNGQGVVLLQNSINASFVNFEVDQHLYIATDRKAAFGFNRNGFAMASVSAAGMYSTLGAGISGASSMGARLQSGVSMFVSNSTAPTQETVLIDFNQPVTVALYVQAVNGDTIEVQGATLEMISAGPTAANHASSKATTIWGDSLTEGVGSATVGSVPMDWGSQLRRQRPGTPIDARGLGGQTSKQVVDRLTNDPVKGAQWRAILWLGINDVDLTNGGANWWAVVKAQIDRALAFRTSTQTIICTYHIQSGWTVGSAYYVAVQYVNAQIIATYGSRVCDLFTALATASGKVPINKYAITAGVNAAITSGSNVITVTDATSVAVGQFVYTSGSTGLTDGSGATSPTVTAINGTAITLSAPATLTASATPVAFVGGGEIHLNNAGYTTVMQTVDAKMTALGWS